ncbi:flocculation protein FLO11-like [Teleopsis dalmanni]|uniref:flocculation protein FLO11-like n=1 Tax=Teleopsis dalmanni TaxID=139649 RepID=UPI0018CF30CE|nr:flocculation protein FLO11-like [Teleopsis dalmanni]
MYNNPIKATNLEHRDVVLDILSDARVVGPLMQTGLFHADVNRRNYMYVFGHNSAKGPYASLPHSIAGEELAFIFGAPLAPAGPFPSNYNEQEKLLSEAVMAYWTNFAKTGNPKAPWKGTFINSHVAEWDRYDLDWPEFNKRSQTYLNIGIPPSIGYKYRQIYMNFWNKEWPNELNQIAEIQQQPYFNPSHPSTQLPRGGTSAIYPKRFGSEVITGHMSKYGTRDNSAEDPVRTLKLLLQEPHGNTMQVETAENMYNAPPTFGVAKQAVDEVFGMNTQPTNMLPGSSTAIYGISKSMAPADAAEAGNTENGSKEEVAKSESTLQLLIGLIVVFIVLNLIIYSTFLLQKKKKATAMNRKLGGILSYDGTTDDELKRSKHINDGDESYILDVVRKSNTYEAVKTDRSPINGFRITRQLSASTVDTHTKVCEWISGTVAGERQLCTTLKRMSNAGSPRATKKSGSPTFSSLHGSSGGGSFMQQPHKVSVAIDATPQARGNSVLCQEPIEITKLKSDGRNIIICQDIEVEDHELLTPQNSLDACRYSLMRQHSAATEACDLELPNQQLQIMHTHAHSDPVDMYYQHNCGEDVTTTSFMDDNKIDELPDINVTSRDEVDEALRTTLTPAEQLTVIKRRNYPKVLPTTAARDTDSPPMTADLSNMYKRNSLPPNSFVPSCLGLRQPPMPPPRTISTLGRKPSVGRRDSNNITTSPLKLAQDCTLEEVEPEITQNTLIVGPIVPKSKVSCGCANIESTSNESNYSTLKRKQQENTTNIDSEMNTKPHLNELANCGCGATDCRANDKQLPQAKPMQMLCLPTFAAGAKDIRKYAENRLNFERETTTEPTCTQQPAHFTEKIYAIESPITADGVTIPITPKTPANKGNKYFATPPNTPTTLNPATAISTEKTMDRDTITQPNNIAIKPNLNVSKSGIPRVLPLSAITAAAAANELATAAAIKPVTPTTPKTPTATRIPQLHRNLSNELTQKDAIAKIMQPATATSTIIGVLTATTPTNTLSQLTTTTPVTPPSTAMTTLPGVANSTTSAILTTKLSTDSADSVNSSRDSSFSSATTSSSSSSTGTVRTELQQK